jgi:hypothetical protein
MKRRSKAVIEIGGPGFADLCNASSIGDWLNLPALSQGEWLLDVHKMSINGVLKVV